MAGWGVEVVVAGGLRVVIGFGVGALGAMAGRVGDLDKETAVGHEARPPAVCDESPRPVDMAEEGGCYCTLLLVRVEAAVRGGELPCLRFGNDVGLSANLPPNIEYLKRLTGTTKQTNHAPLPWGVRLRGGEARRAWS